MSDIKRKWDKLSDERKKELIDEIIYFFESERDEEIGVVAAEQILNFFLTSAGSDLYNIGVDDAKRTLESRMEDVAFDLDMLKD